MKKLPLDGLVALSILCASGLFILWLTAPSESKGPEYVRVRNIGVIANALEKYKHHHDGHLPHLLSELVPEYICPEKVNCFFHLGWAVTVAATQPVSTDLLEQIDRNGAYIYLGERGLQQDIILSERPSLLIQRQYGSNLWSLTTNGERILRTVMDVETRIAKVEAAY